MPRSLEDRFEDYCDQLTAALQHADRVEPARWYLKGLLLEGGRKSIEPMAARVHPDNVRAVHPVDASLRLAGCMERRNDARDCGEIGDPGAGGRR